MQDNDASNTFFLVMVLHLFLDKLCVCHADTLKQESRFSSVTHFAVCYRPTAGRPRRHPLDTTSAQISEGRRPPPVVVNFKVRRVV